MNKLINEQNDFENLHMQLLETQTQQILSSFQKATEKQLISTEDKTLPVKALYHAPFCVLSHNTDDDPIFNYGNQCAQQLFEMNWDTLTSLPSRLSAESITQQERDHLLAQVKRHGFIDDYQGVRIAASGQRFMIERATVWNIYDEEEQYRGQAAALYQWSILESR
ncbi:MEKHLA domain-containing protein [Eionea flava]